MMKKMGDEVLDECMRERYGLAKERIREIRTEETVKEPFGDFFRKMAQFLSHEGKRTRQLFLFR